MANEVSVEITIEERQALRALTKLTRGVDKTTDNAERSVRRMDAAFASFAGNLAANVAGRALGAVKDATVGFISSSIDAAANVEKLKTQFEVLTGSTEKASELFKELTEFSATTPFQLNNIAEASAQLLSFGFSASEVRERIEQIGEVAAGSNSDLKEVALIYGQVAAAGKLTGERLLQLQERAIPIGPAIAKTMGVAESRVRELVSAGKVTQEVFEEAFNSMSQAGGLFEGAINKQSQTVLGSLSTLSDNFDILKSAIGEAFTPSLIEGANEMSVAMQAITKAFKEDGDKLASAMSTLAQVLVITPTKFWVDFFTSDEPSKSLSEINTELENLERNFKLVQEDFRKQKENAFSRFIGADQESLKEMSELIEKINVLKRQRDELIKQDSTIKALQSEESRKFGLVDEPEEKKKKEEDPKEDPRVKKELAVKAEIEAIQAETALREEEEAIRKRELQGMQTEADLEQLRNIEMRKIEIKADAEMQKAQIISDQRERELQEQKIQAKKEQQLMISQAKFEQKVIQQRQKQKQQQMANLRSSLGTISTLQQSSNKELFNIGKAAALAQHAINVPAAISKALGSAPPPFNFALAALVGTAMAVQGAKIASAKPPAFQDGGVVGGFTGATSGPDNVQVLARRGEMFLNAEQQRNLFDQINTRENTNDISDLRESIREIASQEMVVQIDGKEIARATRNAQRDGFRISA